MGVYRPPETPLTLLRRACVKGGIRFDTPPLVFRTGSQTFVRPDACPLRPRKPPDPLSAPAHRETLVSKGWVQQCGHGPGGSCAVNGRRMAMPLLRRARVDISLDAEPHVIVVSTSGKPSFRVLTLNGKEVHRCEITTDDESPADP